MKQSGFILCPPIFLYFLLLGTWHKKLFQINLLIIWILFGPLFGMAQSKDNIGLSVFSTYNKQADYTSRFGNVSYQNALQIYGNDFAIDLYYKRRLQNNLNAKIGIGYLDFEINKISNKTGSGNSQSNSNSRPISYPSTIFLLYSTTKYHYITLLFHLGIEKQFQLHKSLFLQVSLDYFHVYTFSQHYYITGLNTDYKTKVDRNFGDIFLLDVGLARQFKNVEISPKLILPIYKTFRQDAVFKEDPNNIISNWFSGVGFSLEFIYNFH